jgi:hypothetical protein
MPRTARTPHESLTLVGAAVAAVSWGSLALRAVVMDEEPSVRALFVCVSLVIVGFVIGVIVWILASPRRAKRPPSEAARHAEMSRPSAMLAIMIIGAGASPIVDASEGAWGWALMVPASLVGGLLLGVASGRGTVRHHPAETLGSGQSR